MKRRNKKFLTMALAGVLCTATIGGMSALDKLSVFADTDTEVTSYELSNVFASKGATFGCNEANTTTFAFSGNGTVNLKRNLAFKWYEGKNQAKYLTVKFAFDNLNFEKVALNVESSSAWATEDEKTKNSVVFEKSGNAITVKVNDGESKSKNITAGQSLTLALNEGTQDGQFGVMLDGEVIGTFENIGENYAKYSYDKMIPLQIEATLPKAEESEEETTKESFIFSLEEINGQSFKDVTTKDNDYLVKDTAAPVLVVNEKIGGFLLATETTLDYEKIDVLQSSNLTSSVTYYQWNPIDEGDLTDKYVTPKSTKLFFPVTGYELDGKQTSVIDQYNAEYVSLKVKLGDKEYKDDEAVTYDLSWYASESAVKEMEGVSYIIVDRNTQGPSYTHLKANTETKTNEIIEEKKEAYETALAEFRKTLTSKANAVYAGSNSNISLPSVKWLLDDNNGFRNMNFVISYKTPNSDTATATSSLSYSGLKFPVKYAGFYEFKLLAMDKANNNMQYYVDGELVDITSTNVWDIDEIPTFRFEIKNQGLKATEGTIKDKSNVGEEYSFSDIKIVGATTLKEAYALYRIDAVKAEKIGLDDNTLSGITYSSLADALIIKLNAAELKDSYTDLYLDIYAELLQKKLENATVEQVKECFVKIEEFDNKIDEKLHAEEWKKNNQYNWSASSQKFTAAESGTYVILADYWESELPMQRAAAYKVVTAGSAQDIFKGTSDWLDWVKTNVVSVILFAIAGVMLILIIILLLIKPNDETLEDIDKKAEKKAAEKKDEDK